MNRSPLRPLRAPIAALVLLLLVPAVAEARVGVDLRVVTTAGRTLVDVRQHTGTVNAPTSPRANCFGSGSAGSGRPFRIDGPTALGAVVDASRARRALRPLLFTDAFAAFGLGVCGIGGHMAGGSSFWYLKVDRRGAQIGGSQLRVRPGNDVLWYLAPSFPPPPELELRVRTRVRPGAPFFARVFAYDDNGLRTPAAGATITGAGAPVIADQAGRARVRIGRGGWRRLRAWRGADIPSRALRICVRRKVRTCPRWRGRTIIGSNRGNRIRGTGGPDRINARRGRNRINVRDGVRDFVRCGRRFDVVIADRLDRVARNCNRVIRPRGRRGAARRR